MRTSSSDEVAPGTGDTSSGMVEGAGIIALFDAAWI